MARKQRKRINGRPVAASAEKKTASEVGKSKEFISTQAHQDKKGLEKSLPMQKDVTRPEKKSHLQQKDAQAPVEKSPPQQKDAKEPEDKSPLRQKDTKESKKKSPQQNNTKGSWNKSSSQQKDAKAPGEKFSPQQRDTNAPEEMKTASEVSKSKEFISTQANQDKNGSEKSLPQQKDVMRPKEKSSLQQLDVQAPAEKSPPQQKDAEEPEEKSPPHQKDAKKSKKKSSSQQNNTKGPRKKSPSQQKDAKAPGEKSFPQQRDAKVPEEKLFPQSDTQGSEKRSLPRQKDTKGSKKKSPTQQKGAEKKSSSPQDTKGSEKKSSQQQNDTKGSEKKSPIQQISSEGPVMHSLEHYQPSSEAPAVNSPGQGQSSSEGPAVHSREQNQPSRECAEERSCEVGCLSCRGLCNCVGECYENNNKLPGDLPSSLFAQGYLLEEHLLDIVSIQSTELMVTAHNSTCESMSAPFEERNSDKCLDDCEQHALSSGAIPSGELSDSSSDAIPRFEQSASRSGAMPSGEQSVPSLGAMPQRPLADDEVPTLHKTNYSLEMPDSGHDDRDQVSFENSVPGTNSLEQVISTKTMVVIICHYDRFFLLMIKQLPISHEKPKVWSDVVSIRADRTYDYGKAKSVMKAYMNESTYPLTNRTLYNANYTSHHVHVHLKNNAGIQTGRKIIEAKPTSMGKVLKTTDNAWKPVSKSGATVDHKETILRVITSVLNKICPENYDKLKEGFRETILSNADLMPDIINVIIEKALLEKYFSAEYAALCWHVVHGNATLPPEQRSIIAVNFRKSLLDKCLHEFEKKHIEETKQHKELDDSLNNIGGKAILEKEHNDKFVDKLLIKQLELQSELKVCRDEEKRHKLAAQIEELESCNRRKSVGLIKFIAELYRVKMLPPKIILNLHLKLVDAIHKTLLAEMLCTLFLTVAEDLWLILAGGEKQQFSKVVDKIRQYVRVTKDIRIKFMLQDVLDFFDAGFVALHKSQQKKGPTTKKEVLKKMNVEKIEFENKTVALFIGSRNAKENYQADNRRHTPYENSDRESHHRFDKIINSSDNSKRPMVPLSFGVRNIVAANETFTVRPKQNISRNKGLSGSEYINVSNSTVSSTTSNYAYGNVDGGVRLSEDNTTRYIKDTDNREMQSNRNFKQNQIFTFSGQQIEHIVDRQSQDQYFHPANVMKSQMRDNPFRSNTNMDNMAGQRSQGNTQEWNPYRGTERNISSAASNYFFEPDSKSHSASARGHAPHPYAKHQPTASSCGYSYYPDSSSCNVAPALINSPRRHALHQPKGVSGSGYSHHDSRSRNNSPVRANSPQRHQPTAFSSGYSNHQDYVSRNVALARTNLPHRHTLHDPTASSSGFIQPLSGLVNSAHRDEHRHDDGEDEKLKQLCNTILLEFYDSKNVKEAVEEINRRVGARKVATFLEVALQHCIETKPANGELSSSLFAELFTRKLASAELITGILKPTMEEFADLSVDIPQLPSYMARMFRNLIRTGVYTLAEVWSQAQSTDYQKHKLFLNVLQSLASINAEETRRIWEASDLTWGTIFAVEQRQRPFDVEDELKRYNLSYLHASSRAEEGAARQQTPEAAAIQVVLENLLGIK